MQLTDVTHKKDVDKDFKDEEPSLRTHIKGNSIWYYYSLI